MCLFCFVIYINKLKIHRDIKLYNWYNEIMIVVILYHYICVKHVVIMNERGETHIKCL